MLQKVSTNHFYTIQCSHIVSEQEEGLQSPAFPVPSLRGLSKHSLLPQSRLLWDFKMRGR